MLGSGDGRGRVAQVAARGLAAVDGMGREHPQPDVGVVRPPDEDVSVVVQGPLHAETPRVLRQIRRVLPGSELVLSTWRGSDTTGCSADVMVLSEDPGPVASREVVSRVPNNINRQVTSTRAGLLAASRPLALKLRSDQLLLHDGALRLFRGWPTRSERLRILQERVIATLAYSFNPRRTYRRFTYMVSDWSHFGLLEDLLQLWDPPAYSHCFEWLLGRRTVTAEQWLWMSLLNRHGGEASFDRPDVLEHSELSIANNVVLVEPEDFGVRLLKAGPHPGHVVALYTHGEWVRLYRHHCEGHHVRRRDRQALLRAAADRLVVRGLRAAMTGPPDDLDPATLPVRTGIHAGVRAAR